MAAKVNLESGLQELKLWMNNKFNDLQNANKEHGLELNGVSRQLEVMEAHVFDCIVDCSKLKEESAEQNKINIRTDERLNILEYRQNKNVLHFYNIPDLTTNTAMNNINNFIESEMGLTDIKVQSASRVVKLKANHQASSKQAVSHIIARFLTPHDAEQIKRSAYSKPRGAHKYGIEEDLPQEWRQHRRQVFRALIKPAKSQGKKVRWVENRLYIDGRFVNTESHYKQQQQHVVDLDPEPPTQQRTTNSRRVHVREPPT